MRLFIAMALPEDVTQVLRAAAAQLPEASMSKAGDFHLTLKFLGDCDESKMAEVKEALGAVHIKPFEAKLGSIGVFGGNSPRVVWVGVDAPREIFDLAKNIENAMSPFGFAKENRFVPHITVARIKHCRNPEAFLKGLKEIPIPSVKFYIDGYFLFKSELSAGGAKHTKIQKF